MKTILVLCLAVLMTGCATLVDGGKLQPLTITSDPPDAHVVIHDKMDDVDFREGQTPFTAQVKRNHDYLIRVTKDGYDDAEATVERKSNGWTFANILLGGIVGFYVDTQTGAAYDLSTHEVQVPLKPSAAVADASQETPPE